MERMDNDSLRDRIAMALGGYTDREEFLHGGTARLRRDADTALAALGLDDLGAVEQRIAQALAPEGNYDPRPEGLGWHCDQCRTRATLDARTALAAALTRTATPESENTDG